MVELKVIPFLEDNPDFVSDSFRPDAYMRWVKNVERNRVHTRGAKPFELLHKQRPNENQAIYEYRISQSRPITKQGTNKAIDKLSRTVLGREWSFSKISETSKEWLKTKPFRVNGQPSTLKDWLSNAEFSCMLEDANGMTIGFPLNANDPSIAPAELIPVEEGGQAPNEPILPIPYSIESTQFKAVHHSLLSWQDRKEWEYTVIENGKEIEKTAPYFWFIDFSGFYRLVPVGEDRDGNIQYSLRTWYEWEFDGDSLINYYGGSLTKDPEGEDFYYFSSFIEPMFIWGDEALIAFNENQSVRTRFNHPQVAIAKRPCPNADCFKGKIAAVYGKDKKLIKPVSNCTTCNGHGELADLSIHDTLIIPEGQTMGKEPMRPLMEFYNPEIGILDASWQAWEKLLDRSQTAVNLDLLAGFQESGEAHRLRLTDLTDFLNRIGGNVFSFVERLMWQVETLLVTNPNDRVIPVVKQPNDYDIKSQESLLKNIEDTPESGKIVAEIELIRYKFSNDPIAEKVNTLYVQYAPMLHWSAEELRDRISGMLVEDRDLQYARKDYGLFVMGVLADEMEGKRENSFIMASAIDLFKMADEKLVELGFVADPKTVAKEQIQEFDENGNLIVVTA